MQSSHMPLRRRVPHVQWGSQRIPSTKLISIKVLCFSVAVYVCIVSTFLSIPVKGVVFSWQILMPFLPQKDSISPSRLSWDCTTIHKLHCINSPTFVRHNWLNLEYWNMFELSSITCWVQLTQILTSFNSLTSGKNCIFKANIAHCKLKSFKKYLRKIYFTLILYTLIYDGISWYLILSQNSTWTHPYSGSKQLRKSSDISILLARWSLITR